jgi:hypothetical protein
MNLLSSTMQQQSVVHSGSKGVPFAWETRRFASGGAFPARWETTFATTGQLQDHVHRCVTEIILCALLVACALDCNGFGRLWLDSHGLCVIAMIYTLNSEEETKKL